VTFQTGRQKTGGRRQGVVNKRTRQQQAEIVKSGISPLDYMLKVMRDPKVEADRRDRMAAAAAPFQHPRLAVIDSTVRAEVTVKLSADELRARAREAIRAAFAERTPLVVDAEYKVIAGKDNREALPTLNGKAMKSDT
jgi:hypothetical protein